MLKDLLLWFYWHPFRYLIQRMPVFLIYRTARLISFFFYTLGRRKKKAFEMEFLFLMGNSYSQLQFHKTIKEAFFIFVCNELDMMLYPVMTPKNISSFTYLSGIANLDKALSQGKGAILLFGHFGNNQMVMPAIGYRSYKMNQLSAPATVWKDIIPDRSFSFMEKKAMEERWKHELSLPVNHINIFSSLKSAFTCLKRNEVLGVAADGGGGKQRVAVNLLKRKAYFSVGAIEIARRLSAPVLPTFMIRDDQGRNTMIIEPAVHVKNDEEVETVVAEIAQIFANRLEEYILSHPSHYLNFLSLRRYMAKVDQTPFFIEKHV